MRIYGKLLHTRLVLHEMTSVLFQLGGVTEEDGKPESTVDQDVQVVRKWLETQPHLPEVMEDIKIRNFLTLNKCSIEKTKQKIDMYYTIRSVTPEVYEKTNPKLPHMQLLMDTIYCCVHPKLVQGLYRVYFIKAKKPNTFTLSAFGMHCLNIYEVRLHEDRLKGDIIVFDMSTFTFADLTGLNPVLLAKQAVSFEKVYSMRIKQIYIVNGPSYVAQLLALLKAVVNPKIFNRIEVCRDESVLKNLMPRDDLPKDYGGDGPSLEELNEMVRQKLAQYQDRFDQLDKLKVDENLRPKKLNNDEVLGFHGNFKKLNVD
ncbi:unnamed protein product [Tenebrio molitor]|nr:unnamed protein product [Tenebrio molitor]